MPPIKNTWNAFESPKTLHGVPNVERPEGNVVVTLPRRIVEEIAKGGLSVEDLIVEAVGKALSLDPEDMAMIRVEIAEKSLIEAEDYLSKGDVVQASEKLYKAAEECIKALAKQYAVPQLETARRRGGWDTWLLGQAATDLARRLGEERISYAWSKAYEVHVWSFHEAKYRVEDVETALPIVSWLLSYARGLLERR